MMGHGDDSRLCQLGEGFEFVGFEIETVEVAALRQEITETFVR
jgi:hypothetical protein